MVRVRPLVRKRATPIISFLHEYRITIILRGAPRDPRLGRVMYYTGPSIVMRARMTQIHRKNL